MATIRLVTRSKKNPCNLNIRFSAGRENNFYLPTKVFVNPNHWDNKKSNYKKSNEIEDRMIKAAKFERLKSDILNEYNTAYMNGEVTDPQWLEEVVKDLFDRPEKDKGNKVREHFVYYLDFCEYWLKEIAPTWKTEKNKFMSKRAIQQYDTFVLAFKNFQNSSTGSRYRIKDVNSVVLNDFSTYLCDEAKFAPTTSKRLVGRVKFFLNRAEKTGIKTDPSFKERVYVSKEEGDILVPYLNEEEISRIFNLNLEHDHILDNIRDSFIISLWSGLRISDFNNNLKADNIEGDYISIKTNKTGSWVTIPLHNQVKFVLSKRFGNLPAKFSDKLFNKHIKTICMLAEIDEDIKGKLFDKETKRKLTGIYPKYKLISSHSGRRSFASNLHGFVPNHILSDLGGWSSEKMMLHYVKRTKKESAEILKNIWDEKYK
ncbi:site specific recombinase, tyrosine [Cellulophaga phage phi18:3]|uniref:Integrase n=1 Tax=Cellulophaga phage phi18:3 TaxID=1327983 RepID=R9ZYY8_9CAUD|nr:site specific recombinase, tyrosine [Cellulophaga phage phi18:3]AGO48549.1 site specific recombinase, tyrosine [Cellulophaga phage phi18:3]